MTTRTQPRRNRGPLWALVLLFFAPLLLAAVLYFGSGWRPGGHTNHGTLIQPVHVLPQVSLPRADGTPAPAAVLRGKWTLLYIGVGSCDAACRDTLYYSRQTRESLGQLLTRVQRVFLATSACCDRDFLRREHPDLITLDAAGPAAAPLLAQIPADARDHTLFIIDPLGNLMMRYDAHADPKGLREDMKKLLNLSQID